MKKMTGSIAFLALFVAIIALSLDSCAGFGLPGESQVMKDLVGQDLVFAYDNQDWQSMLTGGSKVTFKEGQITKLSILKEKTSSNRRSGNLTYYVNLEANVGERIVGEVRIEYRKMDQGWKIREVQSVDQVTSFASFSMIAHNEYGIDEGM